MSRPIGQWRALALRSPYILDAGPAGQVAIPWPSPDQLLAVSDHSPTVTAIGILADKQAPDLIRVLADLDYGITLDVIADMRAHFGCVNSDQLVSMIERYGDAIATDLHDVYGLDMLDVFRGTITPDELLTRIRGLARHSRWAEAMAQDDELAALPSDSETSPRGVPYTEWTPEVEHIAIAVDRLGAVIETIASIVGGTVRIPPLPRPIGAAERLAERLEDQHYDEVTAAVEEAKRRWAEQHPEEG